MLPAWIIRKVLPIVANKAKDALDAKTKLDNPPADSPMPEEEEKEQDGVDTSDANDLSDATDANVAPIRRPRRKKITAVRGGGVGSFLELGEQQLELWADTLTDVYGYKPKDKEDDDADEDVDDGEKHPDTPQESDGEDDGSSIVKYLVIFGLIPLIGFIAKYGIKLVERDGKKTIEMAKWKEFLAEHGGGRIDYSNATYTDGNIIERSGLAKGRISSQYNEIRDYGAATHKAIDIAVPIGTPIEAPFDGYINYVDSVDDSKAGKYVEIASLDGRHIFRYLHLSETLARAGQKVRRGDIIAKSGNTFGGATRPNGTPWSSGPHVHLEYRRAPEKIAVGTSAYGLPLENPMAYGATLPRTVDYVGGSDVQVTFTNPTTIGIEGKNLMSVRDDGRSEWLGTIGTNTNRAGNFVAFDTYEHALRAGMISLQKYQTVHDVSDSGGKYVTIQDIAQNDKKHSYIDPRNGDRVEDWVRNVSEGSGFAPDERIDLTRTADLARITRGIARAEHSATPNYDDVELVIRTYSITNDLISNTQVK